MGLRPFVEFWCTLPAAPPFGLHASPLDKRRSACASIAFGNCSRWLNLGTHPFSMNAFGSSVKQNGILDSPLSEVWKKDLCFEMINIFYIIQLCALPHIACMPENDVLFKDETAWKLRWLLAGRSLIYFPAARCGCSSWPIGLSSFPGFPSGSCSLVCVYIIAWHCANVNSSF